MKKEKSCGCIIVNEGKVLLVYERRRNFWGFPKGHVEANETEIETATREISEEVGLEVEIDSTKRYTLNYVINGSIDKTIVLFLARPKTLKIQKQYEEISSAKWFTISDALSTLTFKEWQDTFKKVIKENNL